MPTPTLYQLPGGQPVFAQAAEARQSPEQTPRLEAPTKLPSSTPASIVYRFISDFLAHTIGRLERWEYRNGFEDTSGYSGGIRRPWFEAFPKALERVEIREKSDVLDEPAYRFWFLLRHGKPVLCLETTGVAYCSSGNTVNLFKLYQQQRRIWPLIAAAAMDRLP